MKRIPRHGLSNSLGVILDDAIVTATLICGGVLEACPDQPDLRLTVLRPAKEEDTPDLKYVPLPGVKEESGAKVVAVSETTTAVYVPAPRPSLMIVDETGSTTANLPLPKPPSPEAAATRPGDLVTWWTGDAVMVFSGPRSQPPRWAKT